MPAAAGSLDANVLLRLLLNDIPEQHQSVVSLFGRARGQFTVADTAIIELVFVLERNYGFTRVAIADAVEGLLSLPEINGNRRLFSCALLLFQKRPALSFEDCCLATYAELSDAAPLWTFDKKLANQAPSARLVPSS